MISEEALQASMVLLCRGTSVEVGRRSDQAGSVLNGQAGCVEVTGYHQLVTLGKITHKAVELGPQLLSDLEELVLSRSLGRVGGPAVLIHSNE